MLFYSVQNDFILNYAIMQKKIGGPGSHADTYGSASWAPCRPISKTGRTPGGRPTETDKKRTKSPSVWVDPLELL